MRNVTKLNRSISFLLCAAPLSVFASACGASDATTGEQSRDVQGGATLPESPESPASPGAAEGASGVTPRPEPRPIVPGVPVAGEREPEGRPRPVDSCEFGGFGWQAQPFALYPDEQACLGDQWVRYEAGLGLWVGLTACSSDEARVYLSASPEGPFYAAADSAGHGQDHCELVNADFTLTDEDDITSGGCTDCSTGPNLPLEGLPVYVRPFLGQPFEFVAEAPFWTYQASRLRCGVEFTCGAAPPPPGDGVTIDDCVGEAWSHVAPKQEGGVELVVLSVYETHSGHGPNYHPPGAASVRDSRANPHALVLSSYEPAHWTIDADAASGLTEVILNGYHKQTVSVSDRVKVVDRSGVGNYFSACGYAWPNNNGGCDTPGLVSGAEEFSGLSLSSFDGCYQATSFQVRDDARE